MCSLRSRNSQLITYNSREGSVKSQMQVVRWWKVVEILFGGFYFLVEEEMMSSAEK